MTKICRSQLFLAGFLGELIVRNSPRRNNYEIEEELKNIDVIYKTKNYKLIHEYPTLVRDDVMFIDILPLAKSFIDLYKNKEIDRLVLVYNHYINSLTQEVVFEELLPITNLKSSAAEIDYLYETGIEKTLNLVLPMYVQDMIYGIILDAKVSEHSARMNSMRNATDNAKEVISKLQLLYNRARQGAITTELIDIIGGANAIGGDA